MPSLPSPRRRALLGIPRMLIVALSLIALVAVPATPARALEHDADAEALLVGWINEARIGRGLAPLVAWQSLRSVADARASQMAATNTLSHTAAGDLVGQLRTGGVAWFGFGEAIGYAVAGSTADDARSLFQMWQGSPSHWDLMMSDAFNYIGIGLQDRTEDRRTFASVVLAESPDHSGPSARIRVKSRSGQTIRWAWSGADRRLQTRMAGLRDFDVQYRVNGGAWKMIQNDTKATSLTLRGRPSGRTYSLRVRATDRSGNVGAWTNASRIRVP